MSVLVEDYVEPMQREDVCEHHGQYTSLRYFNVWTRCQKCISEAEESEAEFRAQQEREKVEQQWASRIGRAQIPERFQDRTLETYALEHEGQCRALEFAHCYAKEFDEILKSGRCAIFLGRPGTGKTHLAIGIALDIMQKRHSTALFSTVIRAIRRVKETWKKGASETESGAIASFVFPDLLILDEVGVQYGSDAEKLILFDILNERYEQRKPVILISNMSSEGVKAYLGERLFDRMREDGGQIVVFDWESWRVKRNG